MTIRTLLPEDYVPYRGICTSVLWGTEDIRSLMQNPTAHVKDDAATRLGAFDDNGTLLSAMRILPYTMRMNGNDVKMGGIASVVTSPEARGMGLVRKLMHTAFETMLSNGQNFSYLYPFSYEYYRKFGYELCHVYNNVNIPINQFSGYSFPKNLKAHEPGDDITPFMNIYESFAKDRNLAFVRNKQDWQNMLNRDPYKNHEFTYLNRDENGEANAYILYSPAHRGLSQVYAGYRVAIKELCWKTPAGLHDIFGFISKLSPEYDSVDWKVPCDVNIHAIFPNAFNLGYKREGGGGMSRILDVVAGLSTLRAPDVNGKLALQITDVFWPGNSGIYEVEFENGHLTARKTTTAAIDMATDIETLVQLVTGSFTPEECLYKKSTQIFSNYELITKLFPKQKLHMTETF